jgi:hypothetical protein
MTVKTWYDKGFDEGYEQAAKIAREQFEITELWIEKVTVLQAEIARLTKEKAEMRTAMSSGMYASLNHVAEILDSTSVVGWLEVKARALGFVIGYLRRQAAALSATEEGS